MSGDVETALSRMLREEWPRLVAAGMRILDDFQAAEDAAQETLLAALDHWPLSGVPDRPGGWLMTVCRRRALNALRDRQREADRMRSAAEAAAVDDTPAETPLDGPAIIDDQLRLMAMCCHPVLPFDAQVALTLRMVAGLTTEEIAAAFHQPIATAAQRLVRAKRTLRSHRIGFADDEIDLPVRLPAVLDVLTLVFNEGYLTHAGSDLTRPDLAGESHRLTMLLTAIVPGEGGPWALRALQSFHLSRSCTRTDDNGNLLTLDEQDRRQWDHALIDDGRASLDRARQLCKPPTALLLQAELAACHATAPTFEDTDWRAIVERYDQLMALDATPVVELNRAIAIAMRDGPAAALPTLNRLVEHRDLARSHRVWAVRAELRSRLHDNVRADQDYQRALELVGNDIERAYLVRSRQQFTL
jgi:RNA polymerase sigma-70 factor, ECF subfamily